MKSYTLVFMSLIMIAACGGGGGGGSDAPGSGYTTPTNNPPSITNTDMNVSVVENQTTTFTVNATDPNGDTLSYALSGDDASLLSISNQGVVTFNTAPDFENPSDADTNNIYKITVTVSDGYLSATANFEITVTNDTSDDETYSAWDGNLVKDDTYNPYDKHLNAYGLVIAGLPDVTDSFMTNIGNIANLMLAKNDSTNDTDRNSLLSNFEQYKALQRVGSSSFDSYNPPLNDENYPGWDNINDNNAVIDFIWEVTSNSPTDEQNNSSQLNGIIEHLLHTITLIYDLTFNSWSYENDTSELVLAMNEAINGGYYDPTGNYGDLAESDPTAYKRIIAQEFAYWMILTGWDLKSSYAQDSSPEWTIENPSQMESNTPLAHQLFNGTVNGVLVNPGKDYLDSLTFESIPTTQLSETITVSVEPNNNGSGNVYVIDGIQKKSLELKVGTTYTFNHSSSHPFRFSQTSNGTHGGGNEYMNGVTKSSGVTTIEVTSNTPTSLYYYCSLHSGMGGSITITN